MPDRVDRTVWWQLYPLGFVGAEAEARPGGAIVHRLGHLTAWLDYAVDLGVSGLMLGPIFAAATHGYDTIDYFRIDPRLGDHADFDALLRAAHDHGLKVVLDGVFNHVGRGFPAFQQVLVEGPRSPKAPWFRLSWPSNGTEPHYATFEGHQQLVALNHDHREVADYVIEVMNHWLDRGADGWRLDAAYAVAPHFWAEILPKVRAAHPDIYVFGEVIHGDYAEFVEASGVDAVTQYELWKAIWSALNDRNFFELSWALTRHNALLDSFVPLTFVGNHDVTRLASRLIDERHLPHALVILFTCGGTLSIYAGDEQGFRGVKEDRAGGDDAIRPAFPPSPDKLAPHGGPIYRLHQELIALRRRYAWLHHARITPIHLANQHLSYEARHGDHRLLVAFNLADQPERLPVPGGRSLVAGQGTLIEAGSHAVIELPGHGWAIMEP